MLLSMTGFGEGRAESPTIVVVAEVRSINNRHLKISYRSSDGYHNLEPEVERLVRDRVRRGTVQLNVRVERRSHAGDYRINNDVLLNYQEQLTKLGGVHTQVPIDKLLTLPGVISTPDASSADPEADWPTLEKAIQLALEALDEMRSREGKALAADLRAQADVVETELAGVEVRSPLVAEAYRQRLQERVGQAIEKVGVTLQPADLVREVALFVDRSDISEEIVRLRSHLVQFDAAISEASSRQEGVGRKLEFITQEMGREVNTIGSKANDSEISARVVEMKTSLERVREQVQNVE
jgi:uncharacterized protein (TIGR00255 family)